MFIDLTSTAPVIDYLAHPKQLILRVADTDTKEGRIVAMHGPAPFVFVPIVELEWYDRPISRKTLLREYIIRPAMFQNTGDEYVFHGRSAVCGVTSSYTRIQLTLSDAGGRWDLGVHPDGLTPRRIPDWAMLWIPMPDYDPQCVDLTPLQLELAEAKAKMPPPPKKAP